MRELIVNRIHELLATEGNLLRSQRWGSLWYTSDYVLQPYLHAPSAKIIAARGLIHISQIDFNSLSDKKLVEVFETIVGRWHQQM